jgi:hypothetical protein
VPAVVSAAPVSAASVTCPVVYWGSQPKAADANGPTETIFDVRTGRHACYDRLVVNINGSGPVGYDVRYVDNVYTEGRGSVVALAGGAKIQIVVHAPNFDINTGVITYTDRPGTVAAADGCGRVPNLPTGRVRGSFEEQTTFGLGVRAKLPMRAFVLSGPGTGQRLVVDVAHQWESF